ncbi:MAG: hypothetical protein H7068_10720 [Pedobacter sp.]|nr:hypothetical protein [Chitinophagaceae bacterium]
MHRSHNTKIFWHLNDDCVGTTQQFYQLKLNPKAGKHLLTVIDKQGNSVNRNFEILVKEKN